MPQADAQILQIQLDEISRHLSPYAVHPPRSRMVRESCAAHAREPLLHLPPSAPELNLAEVLWYELR